MYRFSVLWMAIITQIGNIVFFVEGFRSAKKESKLLHICLLSAFLTFCGGGSGLRDVLVLRTQPAILNITFNEALPIILIALLMIPTFKFNSKSKTINSALPKVLLIGDSLGVLAFVRAGFERGIIMNGSLVVAVCCAFLTACGGGILAVLVRSLSEEKFKNKIVYLSKKIRENIPYYRFCFTVTMTYALFRTAGASANLLTVLLTPPALFIGLIADNKMNTNNLPNPQPPQSTASDTLGQRLKYF